MKRLNNRETKIAVQNLLCSEEHIIEMLIHSKKIQDKVLLLETLHKNKNSRNSLLDFPEEKDKHKWCTIKHMLLAHYHIMELLNQTDMNFEDEDLVKISNASMNIEELIEDIINSDIDTNCNICKEDLLTKFKKGVGLA